MQSFKVGAPDAEFLEKEYAPVLSAQDIVGIANFKVYSKLNINNSTSRVFSMNTIWTQDYQNKKAPAILAEYSAKKYGRKVEFVEAETKARLGIMDEVEPTESPVEEATAEPVEEAAEAPVEENINVPVEATTEASVEATTEVPEEA
jgi:DNA-directed RNA polymerase beta' subunit